MLVGLFISNVDIFYYTGYKILTDRQKKANKEIFERYSFCIFNLNDDHDNMKVLFKEVKQWHYIDVISATPTTMMMKWVIQFRELIRAHNQKIFLKAGSVQYVDLTRLISTPCRKTRS